MDHHASRLRAAVAAVLIPAALAYGASGAGQDLREEAAALPAQVEVFLQLATDSVAEANAKALRATGAMLPAQAQREHAARISAEHVQLEEQLAARGATRLFANRIGANGIAVRVSPDQLDSLRALPGVRTIGRIEQHEINNIASVPWIGSTRFWQTYGLTGENVSIGIIDTGIDYLHANFGGPGTVAAYNANNRDIIEPGTFPTAKVVGGFDFAGPTYDARVAGSTPTPDPDPLDRNGHGSHVAGSAAGLGVPGIIGPGVAPGARLYALKVFSDAGGSTNLTSLAIEWAMDPNGDGDMSDHLDVINMSLGSPFGDPNDPSAISSNNAAAVGIIVAASAGNEGAVPYVTGAPAVASSAISVAATTPGGRLYARFQATAPAEVAGVYPSLEGAGPVTFAQTGPISGALIPAVPANGCGPLGNAAQVNGNVALVVRGVCSFLVKYQQAQAAGARAIVVYNDGLDPSRNDPIVMGGLNNTVTIPGLMISNTTGTLLAATSDVSVTLDAAFNPALDDQIATFSSRGPGHGGSSFKPDLSAPGVAIVSTGARTGSGAANLQGTSMAAPHVAGAAALLRQLHPGLDNAAIKALLQNSTADSNASGDTDIARQGVGAVRVDAAAALTSYASPAGVSFGRLNPAHVIARHETVTLSNLADGQRTYTVEHVAGRSYPGVSVSCPSSVTVGTRGTRNFEIHLNFDPAAALRQGLFDDARISQTEVDGWCVLNDGADSLRVAYMAVVDPASEVKAQAIHGDRAIRVRNIGPGVGIVQGFTWVKDGGENAAIAGRTNAIYKVGYRAADPSVYGGDPVIEFAIATQAPWEHISNLRFDFFLDVDNDGDEDVRLVATDRSDFQDVDPGQFLTAQFTIGGAGNLDWLVQDWDFNDRAAILPFTRVGGFLGRVPDSFAYRLVVTGRDGTQDIQRGTIDFGHEIKVDLNTFALDPFSSVDVAVTDGSGSLMFLFPNNVTDHQAVSVGVR